MLPTKPQYTKWQNMRYHSDLQNTNALLQRNQTHANIGTSCTASADIKGAGSSQNSFLGSSSAQSYVSQSVACYTSNDHLRTRARYVLYIFHCCCMSTPYEFGSSAPCPKNK